VPVMLLHTLSDGSTGATGKEGAGEREGRRTRNAEWGGERKAAPIGLVKPTKDLVWVLWGRVGESREEGRGTGRTLVAAPTP